MFVSKKTHEKLKSDLKKAERWEQQVLRAALEMRDERDIYRRLVGQKNRTIETLAKDRDRLRNIVQASKTLKEDLTMSKIKEAYNLNLASLSEKNSEIEILKRKLRKCKEQKVI